MIRCSTFIMLFLFLIAKASGQSAKKYELSSNGGLCSATIILFSDHFYNKESGCEASSWFSFGKWEQVGDTIKFFSIDRKSFPLIMKVIARKTSDTGLTVRVIDKNGANITPMVVAAQRPSPHTGTIALPLDTSGTYRYDVKRSQSVIVLRPLKHVFDQKLELNTDTANYFEVTLNITKEWNFHANSRWNDAGNFELIRLSRGLISIYPDSPNDQEHGGKSFYKAANH